MRRHFMNQYLLNHADSIWL